MGGGRKGRFWGAPTLAKTPENTAFFHKKMPLDALDSLIVWPWATLHNDLGRFVPVAALWHFPF